MHNNSTIYQFWQDIVTTRNDPSLPRNSSRCITETTRNYPSLPRNSSLCIWNETTVLQCKSFFIMCHKHILFLCITLPFLLPPTKPQCNKQSKQRYDNSSLLRALRCLCKVHWNHDFASCCFLPVASYLHPYLCRNRKREDCTSNWFTLLSRVPYYRAFCPKVCVQATYTNVKAGSNVTDLYSTTNVSLTVTLANVNVS